MEAYKLHVNCPNCQARGLRLTVEKGEASLVCIECNEVDSELEMADLVMTLSAITQKIDEGASDNEGLKSLQTWIAGLIEEELA